MPIDRRTPTRGHAIIDDESSDSDSGDIAVRVRDTPPLGVISDHNIRDLFEATWRRIEVVKQESAADVKSARRLGHEAKNAVTATREEIFEALGELDKGSATHHANDEGRFGAHEVAMDNLRSEVGRVENSVNAANAMAGAASAAAAGAVSGRWMWAAGVLVPIVIIVIGAWIALDRRVTTAEDHGDALRDRLDDVTKRVDQVSGQVEDVARDVRAIGTHFGVTTPMPAASTTP